MSNEKSKKEAARWITTAEDDLDSARVLQKNRKFAHACFHAQQAGEKAVKALWYSKDMDPWGHSIAKLIEELATAYSEGHSRLKPLYRKALVLDRFYIPTRYPNGLPDITPDMAFTDEDAVLCIRNAEEIIERVRAQLEI